MGRNCIKASSNHERVRKPISEISSQAWTLKVQRDNIILRRGTIHRGKDRVSDPVAFRSLRNNRKLIQPNQRRLIFLIRITSNIIFNWILYFFKIMIILNYLLKYILSRLKKSYYTFLFFSVLSFYFREFYWKSCLSNSKSICEWMRIQFAGPFVCILCLYRITTVIPIRRVANALASGNSEFNCVYRAGVFGRPLGFSNKSNKYSRLERTNKISVKSKTFSKRQ